MCGISGIIGEYNEELKNRFQENSRLFHANRGPDNFGVWQNENIFFTHSRLSIIELSQKANQPLASKSGRSHIIFNGEIYNFKAIAKALGTTLNSDTQLILEAYEKWGLNKTLRELKGMFAFCIYDHESKKAHLARDRFGQKPLYFFNDKGFRFSSDIRVLSKTFRQKLSLNLDSLQHYFVELSTPQPFTIWREIEQLKAAEYMTVDQNGKILERSKYWNYHQEKVILSEEDIIEKTEDLLNQAIKRRTVADVPVGCFLSGGVDSGLIVALLAQQQNKKIKTFSVGFGFDDFNELDDAQLIADRYETDHTPIKLDLEIKDDIEDILSHYGEPFADSSAIPTYYISKEISQHVKVALSGDGGDEMFGGYVNYLDLYKAELWKNRHTKAVVRKLITIGSKLGSRISKQITNYGGAEEILAQKEAHLMGRQMGFDLKDTRFFNFESQFTENHWIKSIEKYREHESLTSRIMLASLDNRLINDYLVKVDRASMANSLEVRSPFLDHELATFGLSIPNKIRFKELQLKYVLKKIGEKQMYKDIFNRKKRGFGVPIKHWLKNELREFAYDNISDLVNRKDYVNSTTLQLLKEHEKGSHDHTHRIWSLVCFEMWLKKYFD